MTNNSTKQANISQEVVSKLVKQDIELDLDSILEELWNQSAPNGILNGL